MASLHADDVGGDVGYPADDCQLGDGVVESAATTPFSEWIVLDGAEGLRSTGWSAGPLSRAGVDRGEPDLVVVGRDEASGVDGQDIVLGVPVWP
jgi:hypothetical protein